MSLKRIKAAIKDETKASPHYRKLALGLSKAGYKQAAKTVRGIAEDESKHRRKLKKILRKLR